MKNHKCDIKIGRNILYKIKHQIKDDNKFFVIDKLLYENFQFMYLKNFLEGISSENIYLVESLEKYKNINTFMDIIRKLNEVNLSRNSVLVGIGGGMIGDICGFISAVYMRGIKFINIPTTLLSQVDSSIGGKNGLNFGNSKNLIGTFKQPDQVIIDMKFLESISKRELISGLAETIKYGIIFDHDFLKYIDENLNDIFDMNFEVIQKIVITSCKFKVSVVERDEFDFSTRKILNYGHTLGHALESVTDYNRYTHGEAVIIGMFYEACISYECGFINREYFDYITNILRKFKIDIDLKIFNSKLFYDSLIRDKKNRNKKISFILPVGYSKVLEYMFSIDEIKRFNYSKYCF